MAGNHAVTSEVVVLAAALATQVGVLEGRRTQAATPVVGRELADLRRREDAVREQFTRAASDLGALPDGAGHAPSSPAAALAAVAAQFVPLGEALLADAAAADAIANRARVLAAATAAQGWGAALPAAAQAVAELYRERSDWAVDVAAEIAAGGVPRLEPTSAQTVAARARAVISLPALARREVSDRTSAAAQAVTDQAAATVSGAVDAAGSAVAKVARITDAAWTAGREAALRDAEKEAERTGSDGTARAVHAARAELGVLDARELPVRGYDALNAGDAIAAVDGLDDLDAVAVVQAYEAAHKERRTVLDALQRRSTELTAELTV